MSNAEDNTIIEATIYLKSGASFTVDLSSLSYKYRSGSFLGMEWTNVSDGRRLSHINIDEVAAVVTRIVEPA